MDIICDLAVFDQSVSKEETVVRLIRSLPLSFKPLDVVSSMIKNNFDQLISTIYAKVARMKSNEEQVKLLPVDPTPALMFWSI